MRKRLGRVKRVWFARLAAACGIAAWAVAAETFLVTQPGDGGPGSLREALIQANAAPGRDVIRFILGPDESTIFLTNSLPAVTDSLVIDGGLAAGSASAPGVRLDGAQAPPGSDGLRLFAPDCEVRGLAITGFLADTNGFGGAGVLISNDFGAVVQGCFLGLTPSGEPAGNAAGVWIQAGVRHQIGGGEPGEGNVISANARVGVEIDGSAADCERISVLGNFIGADPAGEAARPNGGPGVRILFSSGNRVGEDGAGNLISGNLGPGIELGRGASGNFVLANRIGCSAGLAPLPNEGPGVRLRGAGAGNQIGRVGEGNLIVFNHGDGIRVGEPASLVEGTIIQANWIGELPSGAAAGNAGDGVEIAGHTSLVGGLDPEQGNRIAFNEAHGVQVLAGNGNAIEGNAIHDNAGLGVKLGGPETLSPLPSDLHDLDEGPNGLQNAPVLTRSELADEGLKAGGVLESAPNRTFRIEFFASGRADPSGFGEGERFLGATEATADADGAASFETVLPDAGLSDLDSLAATATDPEGNTSEFSAARRVVLALSDFADVWPELEAEPSPAVAGEPFTIRLSLHRALASSGEPAAAEGIEAWIVLPPGLDLVETPPGVDQQGGRLVWRNLSIPADGPAVLELAVQGEDAGNYSFRAGTVDPGPRRLNDEAELGVELLPLETPALSVEAASIEEPDAGSVLMAFPVRLSAPADRTVTFSYRTEAAEAEPGTDYEPVSGIGGIPAGEIQTLVFVPILGDLAPESEETFLLMLGDVEGALAGNLTAAGTILDNDPGPLPAADLAATIAAEPEPVFLTNLLVYTLTVTNLGPDTATNVALESGFPASFALDEATPSMGALETGPTNLILRLETLAPGEGATLEIRGYPGETGALTNQARVYAALPPSEGSDTNQPPPAPAFEDPNPENDAAMWVASVLPPPPREVEVLSDLWLNPQTGLIEQKVRYVNTGETPVPAVRLIISGLPQGAQVYNGRGTTNGLPYVQYDGPVDPGGSVVFLIEFYHPNGYAAFVVDYAAAPAEPETAPPIPGEPVPPVTGRAPMILSGQLNEGRFLLEFRSKPGRRYLIQYRDSWDEPWETALPSVPAAADAVQWLDDGPPKTHTRPGEERSRFYRVLELPNP